LEKWRTERRLRGSRGVRDRKRRKLSEDDFFGLRRELAEATVIDARSHKYEILA